MVLCSTSVNVYFNKVDSYCDSYTCLVSGWVNEYIEGQDSPSLCEVKETGELWYEDELFDNPVSLEFDIPAVSYHDGCVCLLTRESVCPHSGILSLYDYFLSLYDGTSVLLECCPDVLCFVYPTVD